jgi:hypothetical protein
VWLGVHCCQDIQHTSIPHRLLVITVVLYLFLNSATEKEPVKSSKSRCSPPKAVVETQQQQYQHRRSISRNFQFNNSNHNVSFSRNEDGTLNRQVSCYTVDNNSPPSVESTCVSASFNASGKTSRKSSIEESRDNVSPTEMAVDRSARSGGSASPKMVAVELLRQEWNKKCFPPPPRKNNNMSVPNSIGNASSPMKYPLTTSPGGHNSRLLSLRFPSEKSIPLPLPITSNDVDIFKNKSKCDTTKARGKAKPIDSNIKLIQVIDLQWKIPPSNKYHGLYSGCVNAKSMKPHGEGTFVPDGSSAGGVGVMKGTWADGLLVSLGDGVNVATDVDEKKGSAASNGYTAISTNAPSRLTRRPVRQTSVLENEPTTLDNVPAPIHIHVPSDAIAPLSPKESSKTATSAVRARRPMRRHSMLEMEGDVAPPVDTTVASCGLPPPPRRHSGGRHDEIHVYRQSKQPAFHQQADQDSNGFRKDYTLGETVRSFSHMVVESSLEKASEAVNVLKNHDFAFIRRSDGSWTYSILAYRSFEPLKAGEAAPPLTSSDELEECMMFVMSNAGQTKMIKKRQWGEFVRPVSMVGVQTSDWINVGEEEEEHCATASQIVKEYIRHIHRVDDSWVPKDISFRVDGEDDFSLISFVG